MIITRFGVGPQYLGNLLGHMCTLMEVLLAKGENANIMLPPNVVSPMYYLMRVVCAMSPLLLSFTSEQVRVKHNLFEGHPCFKIRS